MSSRRDVLGLALASTGAILVAALGCKAPSNEAPSTHSKSPLAPNACIPAALRKQGNFSALSIGGDVVSFCLFDRTEPLGASKASCFDTDLVSGRTSSRSAPPSATWPASRSGLVLERRAQSIEVCTRDKKTCHTVEPNGFTPPDPKVFAEPIGKHIPSDASPDGKRLFLVRHEGNRSEKIFGETYELATRKLLARFPIEADQHVDEVQWLGERALIKVCVDDGPSCTGSLVDPISGARESLGLPLFGVVHPVTHIRDDLFAIVMERGQRIALRHADVVEGGVTNTIQVGVAPRDPESMVWSERHGPYEIVLAYGGGDVVVVDLAAAKVKARFEPKTCP